MSYKGRALTAGNYLKLDDLQSQFNSSTTTFSLTSGGTAFYPGSAFSILVSLAGVVQEPESAYTIDQSQITFASAPGSGDDFFCIALGVSLGIGVPGEGTVTGTKLSKPFSYDDGLLVLDSTNNFIGVNSTTPTVALDIIGNAKITGISTLGITSTTNLTTKSLVVSGISTLGTVVVGGATTALIVTGNARITGILTVGTGSITIDGINNIINGVTQNNSTNINVSGISTFGATTVTSLNGGPIAGTRNRVINGDMRIDQRNAGASVTPANTYTLDRWQGGVSQTGKFSVQQNAGSITPPTGFKNYLGATSLSAYSVLASDYFVLSHRIEGYNFSDLMPGTASAQTFAISFWVRSSLTGTFGGSFQGAPSATLRSYPFSYAIAAANTWEYKTVAVAGDTFTNTWENTTGIGLYVNFALGAGTSASGTAGTWASANYASATGATSVVGTSGATFYITGVQLEPGTVATPFERRSYGQELALCQRYYQIVSASLRMYQASADTVSVPLAFLQSMRSAPSAAVVTIGGISNGTNYLAENIKATGARFSATSGGGGIIERSGFEWGLSAEL